MSMRVAMAAVLLTVGQAWSADQAWMTDFDAAKKAAAEQKKDLLVDFSGSDWCGWCKKLDAEVFSQAAFTDAALKTYMLVVLDFPMKPENKAKIPEAQQKRNAELQKEFSIRGYPSVLLMDASGKVYAKSGYRPGGPEAYLTHLADLRALRDARNELFAKARQPGLAPADKARALAAALEKVPEDMVGMYIGDMEEIVKTDADGKMGLRDQYQMVLLRRQARQALEAQDPKAALAVFDRIVGELKPKGEALQDVLFAKGEAFFMTNDKAALRTCLDEALAAAPESKVAPRIKATRDRFFPAAGEKPASK